jgi:hypothetical protein
MKSSPRIDSLAEAIAIFVQKSFVETPTNGSR